MTAVGEVIAFKVRDYGGMYRKHYPFQDCPAEILYLKSNLCPGLTHTHPFHNSQTRTSTYM